MSQITGSCLCGQVSFTIQPPYLVFQNCFCSRCRKSSGSAHCSGIIMPPGQFKWLTGEAQVGRYEIPEAEHYATGFCQRCGSNMPWLTQCGSAMVVPAGSLDSSPQALPEQNIFWDNHADWYRLPDTLKTFVAAPGQSASTSIKQ
ncbi:GFA family protein [Pontibacter sp. JAM-7]|uniref:GFA family protein n=1 Tax=Pontibacter sp. JAM-7 TaxID=3366581 RepID=UPI003AF5A0AE